MRILIALALFGCMPKESAPSACVATEEVCDGVDNDCDGVADEGIGDRWYADEDEDGFGDPSVSLLTCDRPAGWVSSNTDCDDTRNEAFPEADERCNALDDNCNGDIDEHPVDSVVLFVDADGDGFGDPTLETLGCPTDPGLAAVAGDCDDTDPTVQTTATVWTDADGDGFGTGEALVGCPGATLALNSDDCDDSDATINPAAVELPGDALDSDCDGDELCYVDGDADGVGAGTPQLYQDLTCTSPGISSRGDDCDDAEETIHPLLTEVCDNGQDDDCDSTTPDVIDADGDGLFCNQDCDDTSAPSAAVQFTEIGSLSGLDYPQAQLPYPCGIEVMSGAAAVADFDGDGDLDLFLPRMYANDLLFQNDGAGNFSEVSAAWNLQHTGSSNGAVWFDADGDADLDLFVTSLGQGASNRLYINSGTSFLEQSVARGIDFPDDPSGDCAMNFSVSAADVDQDGDLDLHQTAWQPDSGPDNDRARIWLNDGTGSFIESSALTLTGRASFTSLWADFDDDGDLDAAIASDWGRSSLWENRGGLVFEDITSAAGVGGDENGMGSAVADVDGDGHLDWFVSSIYDDTSPCPNGWGCTGNRLYLGDGDLGFTDGTDRGVRDGAWSWGSAFFDFDNDGDLDLGVENGFPNGNFHHNFTRLWENDGSAFFTDQACETGLARAGQGRALIPLDIDRDGVLEVLMVHNNDTFRLFRSSGVTGTGMTIALEQGAPNTRAIGATVWLRATPGAPEIRQDVHLNSQFGATAAAEAHFGLGSFAGVLDQVRVVWPDGTEETFSDLPPSPYTVLTRGN